MEVLDMSVKEVKVPSLPPCDVVGCDEWAEYDFISDLRRGLLMYGCKKHWQQHRKFANLGTGLGQKLIPLKEDG